MENGFRRTKPAQSGGTGSSLKRVAAGGGKSGFKRLLSPSATHPPRHSESPSPPAMEKKLSLRLPRSAMPPSCNSASPNSPIVTKEPNPRKVNSTAPPPRSLASPNPPSRHSGSPSPPPQEAYAGGLKRRVVSAIENMLNTEDMSQDVQEHFRRMAAATNFHGLTLNLNDLLRAEEDSEIAETENARETPPLPHDFTDHDTRNAAPSQEEVHLDQPDSPPPAQDHVSTQNATRQLISPVGIDSFDPCTCVKRIGPNCIGSYFLVGWTTIQTIPIDAVERWFTVFKTHFRWLPVHNGHIRENFHRKCAKIISDGWAKMRAGITKGPKWAHPDVIKKAREIFAASTTLPELSERGKRNQKGETNERGPSKHRGGAKPMQYHLAQMAKQLKRQPLPAEVYKRMKVGEDGRFLEEKGQSILERLEESQRLVQMRHPDAVELPAVELVESTADIVGISRRTGMPRLYGAAASLVEGSRFEVTPSQSTTAAGPQLSQQPIMEEITHIVDSRVDSLRSEMVEEFAEIKDFMRKLARLVDTEP